MVARFSKYELLMILSFIYTTIIFMFIGFKSPSESSLAENLFRYIGLFFLFYSVVGSIAIDVVDRVLSGGIVVKQEHAVKTLEDILKKK